MSTPQPTPLAHAPKPSSASISAAASVPAAAAPSHFQLLGGREQVQALVESFYAQMDQRPEARAIRAMHPADLGPVKAVLISYLCEWLGGPREYSAQRGHPRLRMRHQPFAIGDAERDAWLACMQAALQDTEVPPGLRQALMQAFSKTADHLRNRAAGHPVPSTLPRTDHD
ncbi:MAG: globin [Curvibacter sp.]|nr:MAG: globin [Curvibacter sp.]